MSENRFKLFVNTPFGEDVFYISLNKDGSGIFDSQLDKYEILKENVQNSENSLYAKIEINAPIRGTIDLDIAQKPKGLKDGFGILSIDKYIKTSVRVASGDYNG